MRTSGYGGDRRWMPPWGPAQRALLPPVWASPSSFWLIAGHRDK